MRIDETHSETKKRLLTAALIAASLISAAAVAAPAPEPAQIMKFLGQSIDWYRQTDVETHIADQPTDVLFVYQDRQAANQILGLAFQYALAQSQLIAAQNPNPAPADDATGESQVQRLTRLTAQADDTVKVNNPTSMRLERSWRTRVAAIAWCSNRNSMKIRANCRWRRRAANS